MMQFTVKGQTFDSKYATDREVYERMILHLQEGRTRSEFASSLARSFGRYGRWTDGQRPWAHKIVHDIENRAAKPEGISGFENIVGHLRHCRERRDQGGKGLLNPQVAVETESAKVALKLCGNRSRYKGSVSVAESPRFGEGAFYGYISPEGVLESRRQVPEPVLELLRRIAADPANVISQLGRETGHCCYCFAKLTTVQSKIAGCGKTCADNYGVRYPNAAETRRHLLDDQSALVGASDADRWL